MTLEVEVEVAAVSETEDLEKAVYILVAEYLVYSVRSLFNNRNHSAAESSRNDSHGLELLPLKKFSSENQRCREQQKSEDFRP